jgi:hypothetical protein
MRDWKDKEIPIARSRGGKISVCNYADNLIIPKSAVWPHPDIVKKLHKSNQSKAFDPEGLKALKAKLGFYCDLQSLRSEDAITWTVFGTLQYFAKETHIQFVNSMLKTIGEERNVTDCSIQLWRRITHPDTSGSGGPELDFQILADNVIVFGECKWLSKVGENQGKQKDKNQIQLRKEYFEKYGQRIFSRADRQIVLVVGLEEPQNPLCPSITWEEICNNTQHPLKEEITSYYQWKRKYGT